LVFCSGTRDSDQLDFVSKRASDWFVKGFNLDRLDFLCQFKSKDACVKVQLTIERTLDVLSLAKSDMLLADRTEVHREVLP